MKKCIVIVLLNFLVLTFFVFSTDEFNFESGDWSLEGDRLYQNDKDISIAKACLSYPQEGLVEYNFNVRYEDGAFEDEHAGFGIHIFVDEPAGEGRHWGEGNSYLLWLNYDSNPDSEDVPAGLSAQVYLSKSYWDMELVYSISLSDFEEKLYNLPSDSIVPLKITANKDTGEVRIYDPFKESYYYNFKLDKLDKLEGKYVTLRTNSLSFSFGY